MRSARPFNMLLRFLLELAAWSAMAYWGWAAHTGVWRWVWAIGLPLAAMALWGVFRVPGDGGKPVIIVPGWARLILELAEFGGAVWLLADAGRRRWAIIFAVLTVAHYAFAFNRVRWLLSGQAPQRPGLTRAGAPHAVGDAPHAVGDAPHQADDAPHVTR